MKQAAFLVAVVSWSLLFIPTVFLNIYIYFFLNWYFSTAFQEEGGGGGGAKILRPILMKGVNFFSIFCGGGGRQFF